MTITTRIESLSLCEVLAPWIHVQGAHARLEFRPHQRGAR